MTRFGGPSGTWLNPLRARRQAHLVRLLASPAGWPRLPLLSLFCRSLEGAACFPSDTTSAEQPGYSKNTLNSRAPASWD